MTLALSCTLNPWPDAADHARLAEELGYIRVWINDSPVVMPDVWMVLAEIAQATRSIGVGPAVIVPSLRHVVVTAAAIRTLEIHAPGRVSVAVGTGNTGRRLLGQGPMLWRQVEQYVGQLRALLGGDLVGVDGTLTRLLHPAGMVGPPRVPEILIAAMGPKGLAVAERIGDGVFRINRGVSGFRTCVVTVTGTVMGEDEEYDSSRVLRDAGPSIAVAAHGIYDGPGGESRLRALPGGETWLSEIEAIPAEIAHLTVHGGHFTSVDGPDAVLVTGRNVEALSFSGRKRELKDRSRQLQDEGATEIAFHPTGADTARELTEFADLLSESD